MKKLVGYLKPTEFMMAFFGFFAVLAFISVFAVLRDAEQRKFVAELSYESLPAEEKRRLRIASATVEIGSDDAAFVYAERLREATAVALGLSIYLLRERISRNRVLTLSETMKEFAASEVLPPGAEVLFPSGGGAAGVAPVYGLVKTAHGISYVRYSSNPLKIEILATGADPGSGPVFVLRVPDTSAAGMPLTANEKPNPKTVSAGAWATLFEAPENVNHYIPPAFAPVEVFGAAGWTVRPLLQTEFSAEKLSGLNELLLRIK